MDRMVFYLHFLSQLSNLRVNYFFHHWNTIAHRQANIVQQSFCRSGNACGLALQIVLPGRDLNYSLCLYFVWTVRFSMSN